MATGKSYKESDYNFDTEFYNSQKNVRDFFLRTNQYEDLIINLAVDTELIEIERKRTGGNNAFREIENIRSEAEIERNQVLWRKSNKIIIKTAWLKHDNKYIIQLPKGLNFDYQVDVRAGNSRADIKEEKKCRDVWTGGSNSYPSCVYTFTVIKHNVNSGFTSVNWQDKIKKSLIEKKSN